VSEQDRTDVNLRIDFISMKGCMHVSRKGEKKRTDLEIRMTAALKDSGIEADLSQSEDDS
jgi:hypothetical protein